MEKYREISIEDLVGVIANARQGKEVTFFTTQGADDISNSPAMGYGAKKMRLFDIPFVAVGCYGSENIFSAGTMDGFSTVFDAVMGCVAREYYQNVCEPKYRIWIEN